MRLPAVPLVLLAGSLVGAQVIYKQYYEGLPDLDALRPFDSQSNAQAATLRRLLTQVPSSGCEQRAEETAGAREICGSNAVSIRELLAKMAKGLHSGQFSGLWLAELEAGHGQALLAQYDVEEGEGGDRYAAFFAFQWRTERYRVTAASWFLEGSLHAVQSFGPVGRSAFIRFLSCTECHPWVYLVACDFAPEPDGTAYEFSYSSDDEAWQTQIEYELPGMGHSIDAKVETRLPNQTASGPHLLQYFDVQGGEDEWWAFNCMEFRCNPQTFRGKAPAWFAEAWSKARRL